MAYTLLSQSFGVSKANLPVTITEVGTGLPAVILSSATGGLVNSNGDTKLDASGNLSCYVDNAKTWSVSVDGGASAGPIGLLTGSQVAAGASAVVGVKSDGTLVGSDGQTVGLTPAQVTQTQSLVSGGWMRADEQQQRPMLAMGQYAGVARRQTSPGRLVTEFSTAICTNNSGVNLTLADVSGLDGISVDPAAWSGTTKRVFHPPEHDGGIYDINETTGLVSKRLGSRTGAVNLLKMTPVSGTTQITISDANLTNVATSGLLGLWCYLDILPGYDATGPLATTNLNVIVTTNAGSFTNARQLQWNNNQIREGWNFLKIDMRAATHPLGVSIVNYGTGADGNITAADLSALQITLSAGFVGASVYLDSLWTDMPSLPQVCFGIDAAAQDAIDIVLPIFQGYGWTGYIAPAFDGSGTTTEATVSRNMANHANAARITQFHDAGWDILCHTMTHRTLGTMADPKTPRYEVERWRQWAHGNGWTRGTEFYASPQSSTSRISEGAIRSSGYKSQRHVRKFNTTITPFGIDNPHHVGSLDIANNTTAGTYTRLKAFVDMAVAYGDTIHMFWHFITTLGDPGTGEGLTGDNLYIYESNIRALFAYVRELELAGQITVCRGYSGFYYGE